MSQRIPRALQTRVWLGLAVVAALAVAAGVVLDPFGPARPATSPGPAGSPTAQGSVLTALASAGATLGAATPSPTARPTAAPSRTPAPTRVRTPPPTRAPAVTRAPTPAPTRAPTPAPTAAPGTLPVFAHVYQIIMENREYRSIVGSSSAPYINSLIKSYGLAAKYDAVAHPSEPNYLALFSGSTQGVTDDGTYNLPGKNLADQLEAAGKTWHVYAQDYPSTCFTGSSASGGVDGPGLAGTYVRKHNPAISFTDISGNAARCAKITNLAWFDPAAASFEQIVPNLTNDMHDGSIAQGDAFLKAFVPEITGSPAFANSVLFITWDEGTSGAGGGGQVVTIVVSPHVPAGTVSNVAHNHYSLLRTIEDTWGLGCLNNACQANDMREFFGQ